MDRSGFRDDRAADLLLASESAHDGQLIDSLLDCYREALRATAALQAFAGALALEHEDSYQPADRDPDEVDWETEALSSLFWTGHVVFREIAALLRVGLATGALARWRALHELSIRARLIRLGDEETASRYLQHEEQRKRAQERQRHSSAPPGLGDLTLDQLEAWDALDLALRDEYGACIHTSNCPQPPQQFPAGESHTLDNRTIPRLLALLRRQACGAWSLGAVGFVRFAACP
jgi:hypothetical protein